MQNKSLIFKKVPTGYPQAGEHLAIEDRPLDLDARPPDDALLVQNLYFSFDPYLRGRMRPANVESYSPAFLIDQPIRNSAISKVLKSANPKYQEGDPIAIYMSGYFQQYTLLSSEDVHNNVWKLDNPFNLDPVNFLGPLGMPGLTAYSFLYEIAEPKKGETIYISAASGAVGSMVGQLAKREGLTVIGSVGSDDKLDYILEELNFDEGFNYKEESPFEALKRLAPNGIDIYFENVGGNQLEAALDSLNLWGRVGKHASLIPQNKTLNVHSRVWYDCRLQQTV